LAIIFLICACVYGFSPFIDLSSFVAVC
jgi:hypothetical protein